MTDVITTLLEGGGGFASVEGLLAEDKPSTMGGRALHCSYISYVVLMARKLVEVNRSAAQRCVVQALQQVQLLD